MNFAVWVRHHRRSVLLLLALVKLLLRSLSGPVKD